MSHQHCPQYNCIISKYQYVLEHILVAVATTEYNYYVECKYLDGKYYGILLM